jgi:hypothetical protein
VPLRIPRPATAGIATGLALGLLMMSGTAAQADHVRSAEWWLRTLSVTRAWDTTQGTGVTVAVLDTGVDTSQPDLAGSVITGPDYVPSGQPGPGQPVAVHGTEMASLIAGHGHGAKGRAGIVGIAPKARILSVRVTPDPGDAQLSDAAVAAALPDAIAAGIRYAVNNGAQVIDLPMDPSIPGDASPAGALPSPPPAPVPSPSATPTPPVSPPGSGGSAAERAAAAYALARGVVLVAPAGDNYLTGDAPNYPAAYPGVIAVGAFDRQFVKAPYSSRQSYVTVTAAGTGVLAATPTGYQRISSTSAASAIVAGIVALIKSVYPYLTPAQVTEALTKSTVYHPVGQAARGSGHGTVDAARALAEAAIIATPGAQRAGAHAQPWLLPPLPAAAAVPRLAPRLVRDGLLAAGLLVLLLLLIWAYAAIRRRPAGRPVPRVGDALVRYVPPMTGTASRMLEAFAAPALPAPPGGSGYPPGARSAAAPGGPGPAARVFPAGGSARSVPSGAGDRSRPALGPARQVPGMAAPPAARPPVSGSPPWEPAAKPDGELPWTSPPAPLTLAGRASLQPRPVASRDSQWSLPAARQVPAASPAPEGGQPAPQPTVPAPGGSGAPKAWRPPAPGAGERDERALPQVPRMARPSPAAQHEPGQMLAGHAESRPIYVWNPGAATETFPAIPADDGMQPDG